MSNLVKTFKDFKVGDFVEFNETISQETVKEFAEFSKDKNPLHLDPEYSANTVFKSPIAHGMIAGAYFSRLVGMELPGKYSVYLKQTLNFHLAMRAGIEITVYGEVIYKNFALNLLTISTKVLNKKTGEVYVDGEALVKVLK